MGRIYVLIILNHMTLEQSKPHHLFRCYIISKMFDLLSDLCLKFIPKIMGKEEPYFLKNFYLLLAALGVSLLHAGFL